jgi:D-glycerate 3-kinase
MDLLHATLDALMDGGENATTSVPRFDKARDDRRAPSDWDSVKSPVDIVIVEGWCMGALAQTEQQLVRATNALEAEKDLDGRWRSGVNQALSEQFSSLYRRVDQWLMLQAPSFDCVYRWRLEQEHKLAESLSHNSELKLMSDLEVAEFIQYYQRITEQCLLDLPGRVNHLFQLDDDREIVDYVYRVQSNVG